LDLLLECTSHIDGTTNSLELGETIDSNELCVVGNLEGSTNLLQKWGSEVGHLDVADPSDGLSNSSKVWQGQSLEGVVDESKRVLNGCERWDADRLSVTERGILDAVQVWKADFDRLAAELVELNSQSLGDILELKLDVSELLVVVDIESTNALEVNSLKGAELSVRDEDVIGLSDGLGEGEGLKGWKGDPFDRSNLAKLRGRERLEDGEFSKLEVTVDEADTGHINACKLGGLLNDQVTLDALNARKLELGNIFTNYDVSLDGTAAGELLSITIGLDFGGLCIARVGLSYT
jgi:hypothetical protein